MTAKQKQREKPETTPTKPTEEEMTELAGKVKGKAKGGKVKESKEGVEEPTTTKEILEQAKKDAEKIVKQLSSEERQRLQTLANKLILEMARPIRMGKWDVTYVKTRYLRYYLISIGPFPVMVLENLDESKMRIHGSKMDVKIADITAVRVGWLPHIASPENLPAFLLTSSPAMNHPEAPYLANEIVTAFKPEDLEHISEAVEAYQTRTVGSILVDLARDLKSWMQMASRRGLSHYEQSLAMLALLMMWEGNWEKDVKSAGRRKWTTTITSFIKQHKKGVAITAGVILFLVVIGAVLFFLRLSTIPLTG